MDSQLNQSEADKDKMQKLLSPPNASKSIQDTLKKPYSQALLQSQEQDQQNYQLRNEELRNRAQQAEKELVELKNKYAILEANMTKTDTENKRLRQEGLITRDQLLQTRQEALSMIQGPQQEEVRKLKEENYSLREQLENTQRDLMMNKESTVPKNQHNDMKNEQETLINNLMNQVKDLGAKVQRLEYENRNKFEVEKENAQLKEIFNTTREENVLVKNENERLKEDNEGYILNERKQRNIMDQQQVEINNLKTQIQKIQIENLSEHKRKDKINQQIMEDVKRQNDLQNSQQQMLISELENSLDKTKFNLQEQISFNKEHEKDKTNLLFDIKRRDDNENKIRIVEQQKKDDLNRLESQKNKEIDEMHFNSEIEKKQLIEDRERVRDQYLQAVYDIKEVDKQLNRQKDVTLMKERQIMELEDKIALQNKVFQETQVKHVREIAVQDDIYASKVQQLIKDHDYEKKKYKNEINNLTEQILDLKYEGQNQRKNYHDVQNKLNLSEKKARDHSLEAEYWKNEKETTEYKKRLEVAEKEKEIHLLAEEHNYYTQKQSRINETLIHEIDIKNKEVNTQKLQKTQILHELSQIEKDRKAREYEVQYYQQKMLDAEQKKQIEIAIREDMHNKDKIDMKRSLSKEAEFYRLRAVEIEKTKNYEKQLLSSEKEYLQSKVQQLGDEVYRKEIETNELKRSVNILSGSPVRRNY